MKNRNGDFDDARSQRDCRADYFGLQVEVLDKLPIYSSIRYRSREFIVWTQDLRLLAVLLDKSLGVAIDQ
jgi:hypothetical protein